MFMDIVHILFKNFFFLLLLIQFLINFLFLLVYLFHFSWTIDLVLFSIIDNGPNQILLSVGLWLHFTFKQGDVHAESSSFNHLAQFQHGCKLNIKLSIYLTDGLWIAGHMEYDKKCFTVIKGGKTDHKKEHKRFKERFTIFFQIFLENIAGLCPLKSVVQRNVSVDVLQQNVNPGL